MPPPPVRRPKPKRPQWLFSLFLFIVLIFMSLMYITNPDRDQEKRFADAEEVPLSVITRGYNAKEYSEIFIRDNKVFATSKTDSGTVVQSYKARESISELGWNDPKNPTIVNIENREAKNLLYAILPDLLFFILIIGGIFWLFRGIARSQSSALSFAKSRARVADAKQVKTRF